MKSLDFRESSEVAKVVGLARSPVATERTVAVSTLASFEVFLVLCLVTFDVQGPNLDFWGAVGDGSVVDGGSSLTVVGGVVSERERMQVKQPKG